MPADFRDELSAYDDLPAEARRLIAHSPFPIDADRILAFWQRYGTAATVAAIGQLEAAFRHTGVYESAVESRP
jgi:hypothetical protein